MRSCAVLCFLLFTLIASVPAQDTVQVSAGWNIIGSVKEGAIPDVLSTDPPGLITTAFYGYEPGAGYETSDTLKKGLGYWVKAGADGIVIFEGTPYTGCGVKRVSYGGFSYGTVQIGSQCWMSENLNVGVMVSGMTEQADNATIEKYCYNDDSLNCGVYGGLYQWDEAMQYVTTEGAQGICPTGWHMPTLGEFQTLSSTVGGDGNALKMVGAGTGSGVGKNTSGFSALLAGSRYNIGSFLPRDDTYFWSSSQIDEYTPNYLRLPGGNTFILLSGIYKGYGFSVRCLED